MIDIVVLLVMNMGHEPFQTSMIACSPMIDPIKLVNIGYELLLSMIGSH